MKIAFIGEAVSGFGGMETVIKEVIDFLQCNNFETECSIFFFCRNDKMDIRWLQNISYYTSYSSQKISLFRRMKHISSFSSWIKDNHPDIVICFDMISCLYANKARVKTDANYVIFSWPHFSLDHKKHSKYITYADRHLAISSGIKDQIISLGIKESHINLVYNPVSLKSTTIPASSPNDTTQFLYIGRLKFEGQKRIKDLLDGFSKVDGNWHLHVIGDGSDYLKCQQYSSQLQIDTKISWYGWQADPWSLVANEIKTVDALVLTSAFEGFPMVLLEALSWGIPCISSDCVSGPKDMIINGTNGYLYRPNDLKQFTRIINKIITREIIFCHDEISSTIEKFHNKIYYERINDILK